MMQKLVAFVLGVVFAVQIVVADTATVNGITWIYTVVNGVASVGGGSSSSTAVPTSTYGSIAIPSTLGGYRVTSIGRQAFYGCSTLKCVTIPDSVTNIGPSAFYGCRGLDSVTIPGSVSRIENWSFAYCNGLTNVTLSGSVTSIGEAAFWNCSNLASVVIPDSVTNIENEAFYGCSGLTHLILGEGLTNIGDGAFWNCGSLTDVTIPDSVTHVGTSAFAGCNELLFNTNTIAGVRLVDGWVVGYTDSLTGELDLTGIRGIGEFAFSGCRKLTGVVMPSSVISVVYGAFYGCNSLIKVNMPESVTAIEENAFADCTSLESVSIPDGVTDVGDFAFSMCSNLVGVTIPNTLTNIGERAFQGCSSLTRILIPDRVTSIGDDAFYGCTGLTDVSLPANFTSVWAFGDCTNVVRLSAPYLPRGVGSGKLSSVVVPEDVTNIVDSAFYGCSSLTNVIIPSSVKRIGNSAFGDCSSLTDINIPDSAEEIGGHAFVGCYGLTNVTIGVGVKSICDRAFADCSNLKNIFVPDSVESIGVGAFSGCSSLTNMVLPFVGSCRGSESRFGYNGEDLFGWVFGWWEDYEGGKAVDQYYGVGQCMTYWIPASLRCVEITDEKEIGVGAFHNCSELTSVILHEGVTRIGAWAFGNCSGLRTMIVPNSVRTNDGAFSGCMFDKIIMPGHLEIGDVSKDIEISEGSTFIAAGAFHGYSRLRSVTIPNTVTNIGYGAFYDCKWITDIVIPKGVRTIDGQAFYDCTGLKSLSIMNPDVQFTGGATFGGCTNLSDVTLPGWDCGIPFAFGSVTNVVITPGTTSIAGGAFRDCSTIRRVSIPDSVTDVGDSAFAGCSAIERLTIPQSVCSEGLQKVFPDAYAHIHEIEILEGTRSIGQNAFAGCEALSTISIPSSVSSSADFAFSGCVGIERVDIADFSAWLKIRFGVEANPLSVSKAVLYLNGEPLTIEGTFVVTNDVVTIPDYAFRNQTRLTNIVLPDGLMRIGAGAFDGCASLTSINLPDTLTDWGLDSLPPAMREGYAYDMNGLMIVDGWLLDCQDKTLSLLTVPEGVVGIGSYALAEMYDLETVNLPQSLRYIAEGAFREDTYLDNLVIPDGVEIIGDRAFEDCSFIQTMTLGSGIKSVGARAFAGCTQLSSVTFNEGLVEIGAETFNGCWRMQSVSLPLSTTNVASSAFSGCTSLAGVTVPTHGGKVSEWFAPVCSQIRDVTVPEGEVEVRASMFEGCGSLQTVQMPDSITNIAARAFYGCSSLPEVWLPESLMAVGGETFRNCSSLTAAALPENVTCIGARAFQGCSNLSALTLPRGLEALPDYVFADCWSLDSFVVPAAVTNLGNYIVSGSTTAIYYLGNAPAYGANVYGNASGSLTSYVTLGTKGWDGRPNSRDIPASWNGRDILTWSANQFDVTFDANGGLFFPVVTNTYACEETTYTGYSLPPFEPVRKGMDFDGYWTEPNGGTRVFTSTRVLLTKPHTLYAHWKKGTTIKVRFNACGGTVSPAEDDYVSERPYCELPVPVREHFAFAGWWTEANGGIHVEISSEVPKAAHELFAHWTPNSYTIRFHANNGTDEIEDQYFTYGDTVSLRTNTFSSIGNAFAGWALSEDGPAVYADGKTLTDVAAIQDNVIHLYAVWVSTRYTVRFDSHGGVGRMENQTLVKDEAAELYGCAFTRTGYTFVGWAVSTTGGLVYGDGESVVNVYEKTGSDVVLYAVWKSIAAEMCEEVFGGVGVVSANDAWDTVVTLTNDVSGTVEIPDNVGAVTIDLNGHDMVGDGGPAIRIVAGDGEGGATRLAIVDTSEGEKGQISGGGESAGIEVAEDAATGVKLDVEEGVGVFNGDGSEHEIKPKLIGTGKVTVPKSWKTGQKVTWKATADKGSVFARWEGPLVDSLNLTKNERRKPSLAFAVPEGFETNQIKAVFIPLDDDGLYALGITQTEFEPKEAVSDVRVTDDSQSYVTASASGLPTGLKFDAKKMAITGTPTKSGVYWVKIKAKNASGYQWAENVRVTVSGGGTEAKEPKLTRTAYYPLTVICANDGGTVSGTGVYAEGKKVSVKATPAKGYVFAGWHETANSEKGTVSGVGGADYRSASLNVTVPETRYVFALFATKEDDADSLKVAVEDVTTEPDGTIGTIGTDGTRTLDMGACVSSLSLPKLAVSGLPTGLKYDTKSLKISGKATKPGVYTVTVKATNAAVAKATDASTTTFKVTVPNFECAALPMLKPETDAYGIVRSGVKFDDGLVDCTPADGWTVKVAGLPSGLKWNAKIGKIVGVPTAKAGSYTVTFTASKKGEAKQVATITLNVEALPDWVVGTFDGSEISSGAFGDRALPCGLVKMTVAANGKISGKVIDADGTWALSAAAFDSVEGPVSNVEELVFHATVIGKSGKMAITNEVEIAAEEVAARPESAPYLRGALTARSVTAPYQCLEPGVEWCAWQNLWKTEPWKTDAKAFAKAKPVEIAPSVPPVLSVPFASGIITLKFAATGAVTASGKFVTGQDASGRDIVYSATCSSVLIPDGDGVRGAPALPDALDFRVFLYFVPKAGKFDGYSDEVPLVWDGADFSVK